MKFVIVGYGRVGIRTAHILQSEGHEVVIVERDQGKVDRATTAGFEVVAGDGSEESTLESAGIAGADAIGALTGDLNTNFTACMIAQEYGCRTVLRIDADYREEIYEKYAADVDDIIYPERLGAAGAKTALLGGDFNVLADLTEKLSIASIDVPEGSSAIGKRVVEVSLPGDAHIYAHGRAHESMTIPLPQTTIEAGDSLAVMTSHEGIDEVRAALKAGA
jgi:trk system potassium uptake protein TrkA